MRALPRVLDVIDLIESNDTYRNLSPYGEPQLGRRGLYRGIGGGSSEEMALLWVLSLSDGTHDLLEIAERSGVDFDDSRTGGRPSGGARPVGESGREHGAEACRARHGRRKRGGARDRESTRRGGTRGGDLGRSRERLEAAEELLCGDVPS